MLDIRPAATQMLKGMSHPAGDGAEVYDVTFENVQAGLRYDYLFRIANQRGGIVLGTGDLSELALGWCTFGVGDQMSHYGSIPGYPRPSFSTSFGGAFRRASLTRPLMWCSSRCWGQKSPPSSSPLVPARRSSPLKRR
ncbi:NAD synthetase [Cutibacterium acnes JCM 18909]|nr:NAD synthetase [Cutibacterium acnes JCM 18909]